MTVATSAHSDTRPLILILAAAVPSLGIGLNGTLPWHLPRELKYFRQVTTTYPQAVDNKEGVTPPSVSNDVKGGIVIMGRRTWESIPTRFRPLNGRINIVISSTLQKANEESNEPLESKSKSEPSKKPNSPVFYCSSLESALDLIAEKWPESSESGRTKRIFVIGGAQLYKTSLQHPRARHVLLTEVERHIEESSSKTNVENETADIEGTGKVFTNEIDCDTFLDTFPWYHHTKVIAVAENGDGKKEKGIWERQSYDSLRRFLHPSVELPDHTVQKESNQQVAEIIENGYKYQFTLWDRV